MLVRDEWPATEWAAAEYVLGRYLQGARQEPSLVWDDHMVVHSVLGHSVTREGRESQIEQKRGFVALAVRTEQG